MGIDNPILREAAGMDPALAPIGDKDLLKAPSFEYDFASAAFPALNGKVVVRYATVGDMLAVEALAQDGGRFAEAFATLQVCMEKAPASWYSMPEKAKEPILDLRAIPDAEGLAEIYRAYSIWRDSFRRGGK